MENLRLIGKKIQFKRNLFEIEKQKEDDSGINLSEISHLTIETAKKEPGIISNALGKVKNYFTRIFEKGKNNRES